MSMTVQRAFQIALDDDAIDRDALAVRDAALVLATAVEQVRKIHAPSRERSYLTCAGCGLDGTEEPYEWPCDTAKAVGNPRAELTVRWDG